MEFEFTDAKRMKYAATSRTGDSSTLIKPFR